MYDVVDLVKATENSSRLQRSISSNETMTMNSTPGGSVVGQIPRVNICVLYVLISTKPRSELVRLFEVYGDIITRKSFTSPEKNVQGDLQATPRFV